MSYLLFSSFFQKLIRYDLVNLERAATVSLNVFCVSVGRSRERVCDVEKVTTNMCHSGPLVMSHVLTCNIW